MEKYNILVVEDEKNIMDVISAYLLKENFRVFKAMDGEEAIELFNQEYMHLILLDLMLPKLSGEQVCSQIRAISDVPIIMLTAKDDEDNILNGLTIGADDYMVKPFSPRELIGRIKALLRRSYRDNPLSEVISLDNGRIIVKLNEMVVLKDNTKIELTANEFKILTAFINNPNKVLSREQLINAAFGHGYESYDRTIDTYIKNIRQKLEDDPKTPVYIVTVYGAGYRMNL